MADPTDPTSAVAEALSQSVAHGAANNQATMQHLQEEYAHGEQQIAQSLASNQASLDAGWRAEAQNSQQLDAVFDSLNGPTPGVIDGHPAGMMESPMMEGPMMEGPMTEGSTPGFAIQPSADHGDADVIDSLPGLEEALEEAGLHDAQVVEVIVIEVEPNQSSDDDFDASAMSS